VRRKPSRWCETTRAERDLAGSAAKPKEASVSGSRRAESMSVEGREQPGEVMPRRGSQFPFGEVAVVLRGRRPAGRACRVVKTTKVDILRI
jgi:hypothetical protein